MARHKKTKKQKITADTRRKQHSSEPLFAYSEKELTPVATHTASQPTPSPKSATGIISTADYRYLLQDLRKITIVTLAIIAVQLALHFILKI